MTVNDTKDVQLLVKQISDEQDDFEMAHDDEDDLYEAVLKEVVKGNPELAQWLPRHSKRS